MASLEPGEPTLARIPQKWNLDVRSQADGEAAPPVRVQVGPKTTIAEIQMELSKRDPASGAAPQLLVDGKPIDPKHTTVDRAMLFGRRVTWQKLP